MNARWIGPFEVLGELGRGGQGAVYRARHGQSGELVALKLLLEAERTAYKRFLQEAHLLRELRHPHLPRVVDLGEAGGKPYLALELIQGETLDEVVKTRGLPTPDWVVDVLTSVASALDYCHGRGLVHRDLKPANVLIEGGTRRPVLVDFGLAKRDSEQLALEGLDGMSRLSVTGELRGTPAYMAPEQADHESFGPVTPQADVYGLGGVLYFLLCGRAPFAGETTYNLLVKLMREDPRPPREHAPRVDPALEGLCLRALAKEPSERPPGALGFSAELQAARRSPARRRWALLLPLLGVLGLGLGIGVAEFATEPKQTPSATPTPALAASPAPSLAGSPAGSPPAASPRGPRRLRARVRYRTKGPFRHWLGTACPDVTGDGVADLLLNHSSVKVNTNDSKTALLSGATGDVVWTFEGSRVWALPRVSAGPKPSVLVVRDRGKGPEVAWVDPLTGQARVHGLWPEPGVNFHPGSPYALQSGPQTTYLSVLLAPSATRQTPPTCLVELGPEGLIGEPLTLREVAPKRLAYAWNHATEPVQIGPRRVAWFLDRTLFGVDLDARRALWAVQPGHALGDRHKRGHALLPPSGPGAQGRVLGYWETAKPKQGAELVLVVDGKERWRQHVEAGPGASVAWVALEGEPILLNTAGAAFLLEPSSGRVVTRGELPFYAQRTCAIRVGAELYLSGPEFDAKGFALYDAELRERFRWEGIEKPAWLSPRDLDGDGVDEVFVGNGREIVCVELREE